MGTHKLSENNINQRLTNCISGKKVMRNVWLDQKKIIYYELLKPNQTEMQIFIHNDWLDWVKLYRKNGLSGKGKWKVILLHDNARQHVAKTTGEKIEVLGWEVLPRPAYSPDLAPSDYYLFWSMQHFFKEKSRPKRIPIPLAITSPHIAQRVPERAKKATEYLKSSNWANWAKIW